MDGRVRLATPVLVALGIGAIAFAVVRPGPASIDADGGSSFAVPDALAWAPERLAQDWPGPLRPEPDEEPRVMKMALGPETNWDPAEALWEPFVFADVLGDVPPGHGWLDITKLRLSVGAIREFRLDLADQLPRFRPEPAERWIAYGVVLDRDRDGAADVRIGMDNIAGGQHRAWRTDLATGLTQASAGPPYGYVGRIGLDTWFPGGSAVFRYSPEPGEEPLRFYAWASFIERGRVVATDYAPAVGWLEDGAQPEWQLVGPVWTLESEFGNRSVEQTLEFTPAGQLLIDAACNSAVASVTAEGGVLHVTELAVEERRCSTGVAKHGAKLIAFLSRSEIAYSIGRGTLELRAGKTQLQLMAAVSQRE